REASLAHLPRGATVSLHHLVCAESFSEVEHARAVLEALAERYVETAQCLIAQEIMSRSGNLAVPEPGSERSITAAIKLLDEAIPEFRGTEVELQLLRPLLYALKQERFYDRYLDVYLDLLYRHPTHALVGVLADEAAAMSRVAGRQEELTAGLRHISGIPLDSSTKSRIAQSMVRLGAASSVFDAPGQETS
ncbi:MAG TPA: hypothetical protein PK640_18540, partial [Verrucomicrobiota bacterium]|nr:hypothetical protein [Verrucomicrobiota bacterium]